MVSVVVPVLLGVVCCEIQIFFLFLEQAIPFIIIKTSDVLRSTTQNFSTPPVSFETHSYYRLPRVNPYGLLVPFDGKLALQSDKKPKNLAKKLGLLRELFAKDRLELNNIESLMITASSLLSYAAQWKPEDLEGISPARVAEPAACRFLVTDALWNICETIGPNMNKFQWWDQFIAHVRIPESAVKYPLPPGNSDWRPFLEKFRNAIELFGRRIRPEARAIVELKRAIFCNPGFHSRFTRRQWDPWREDDEIFRRSSES